MENEYHRDHLSHTWLTQLSPEAEGCFYQEHKHMNRKKVIKVQYFKDALYIHIPPESAENQNRDLKTRTFSA